MSTSDFSNTKNLLEVYNVDTYLDLFYRLNPIGVSMSTYNELKEITIALGGASDLYVKIMEDGKVDWQDLATNLPMIMELVPKIETAVVLKYPIVLAELKESEVLDLLQDVIGVAFKFLDYIPGEGETTYKDLKEMFIAFTAGVEIFESMAEDGKITLLDVPANLGKLIALPPVIQDAIKIDGKLTLGALTKEQASELVLLFIQNAMRIITAVKKLQAVS